MTDPRPQDWPDQDDWERIECNDAGTPGHLSCGWCYDCKQPFFKGCKHYNERFSLTYEA